MKKILMAFGIGVVITTSCAEKTANEKIQDGLEEVQEGVEEKGEEVNTKANKLFDSVKKDLSK